MPAPTCGEKVIAVKAPSATPNTVSPAHATNRPPPDALMRTAVMIPTRRPRTPPMRTPTTSGRTAGSTARAVESPIFV